MTTKTNDPNADIRQASDNVIDTNKMVSFFYELMRDHLPSGVVEGIVRRVLDEDYDVHYCNGWLARHAQLIVERLFQSTRTERKKK